MGEEDNWSEALRKQLEDVLAQYDATSSDRPDIQKIIGDLQEKSGFPRHLIEEIVKKGYDDWFPIEERKARIEQAEKIAHSYLLSIADRIIGNEPFIETRRERIIKLAVGTPEIDGFAAKIPIVMQTQWIHRYKERKEEKMRDIKRTTSTCAYIKITETEGKRNIEGPTKEEFRQSALEAALDMYAAAPSWLMENGLVEDV
jgi:hypothetical protein